MPNVVIATTMWSKVTEEEGEGREEELKSLFWKDMIASGCRTERFKDTHKSAWRIIGSLADKDPAQILLPRQMVDIRMRLNETDAGHALNKELEKLIKDQKDAAHSLRELAGNQDNELLAQELNVRKTELESSIRATAAQLREMKIPFTRRVRFFLRGRH